MSVQPNVHPEAPKHKPDGAQSVVPHPPPEDHHDIPRQKPIPNTGWKGPIPSHEGGSSEEGFMHKPPYDWRSEGDLFEPKYYSYARIL